MAKLLRWHHLHGVSVKASHGFKLLLSVLLKEAKVLAKDWSISIFVDDDVCLEIRKQCCTITRLVTQPALTSKAECVCPRTTLGTVISGALAIEFVLSLSQNRKADTLFLSFQDNQTWTIQRGATINFSLQFIELSMDHPLWCLVGVNLLKQATPNRSQATTSPTKATFYVDSSDSDFEFDDDEE